jgi:hypothetical protein
VASGNSLTVVAPKHAKLETPTQFVVGAKVVGFVLLGLCILLGTGLRLRAFSRQPLWFDEFIMLVTVRRPLTDSLVQIQDYSAPLYQLVTRLVADTSLPSSNLLRLPALVFGCACIPAAWWFGRLLCGGGTALAVASFVSVNWAMVRWSSEARPYSLFVLASILSMGLFYKLTTRPSAILWSSYLLCALVLVYSHYYGFLCIAAQAAYWTTSVLPTKHSAKEVAPFLACGAVLLLLSTPALWLVSRYVRAGTTGMAGWVEPIGLTGSMEMLGRLAGSQLLGGLILIPVACALWPTRTAYDAPASQLTVGRGCSFVELLMGRKPLLLCFAWLSFSFFFLLVVSKLWRPLMTERHVLPVLVPLACMGFFFVLNASRSAFGLLLTLGLVVNLFVVVRTNEGQTKDGMEEVVAYLNENCTENDEVWTPAYDGPTEVNVEKAALEYYGLRPGIRIREVSKESSAQDIKDVVTRGRVYLVYLTKGHPPSEQFGIWHDSDGEQDFGTAKLKIIDHLSPARVIEPNNGEILLLRKHD